MSKIARWTSGDHWSPSQGLDYMLEKSSTRHGTEIQVEYSLWLRKLSESGSVLKAQGLGMDGGPGSAQRLRRAAMAHWNKRQ